MILLAEFDWLQFVQTAATPAGFVACLLYAIKRVAEWAAPLAERHLVAQEKMSQDIKTNVQTFATSMSAHNDAEMGKLDSIRFDVKEIKAAVQKPEGVRQ